MPVLYILKYECGKENLIYNQIPSECGVRVLTGAWLCISPNKHKGGHFWENMILVCYYLSIYSLLRDILSYYIIVYFLQFTHSFTITHLSRLCCPLLEPLWDWINAYINSIIPVPQTSGYEFVCEIIQQDMAWYRGKR